MCPDELPAYQVYIVESGSGDEFNVGSPVTSLEDATEVVNDLDQKYLDWEAEGFPTLDSEDILNHYEGCDVYCRRGTREWEFNEGEWEELL